jgi:hypothetical protein
MPTIMPKSARLILNGEASGKRWKKCLVSSAKTTGAATAWTMSVFAIDRNWRPNAIVLPQITHPMTA